MRYETMDVAVLGLGLFGLVAARRRRRARTAVAALATVLATSGTLHLHVRVVRRHSARSLRVTHPLRTNPGAAISVKRSGRTIPSRSQ